MTSPSLYKLETTRNRGYVLMPLDVRVWLTCRAADRWGIYGKLARLLHIQPATIWKWVLLENGMPEWRLAQIRAAIEMELI